MYCFLCSTLDEVACYDFEKNWLRNNIAPSDEVLRCWNDTFLIRYKEILENQQSDRQHIIEQWPRLTDPDGYLLVDADFIALFGANKTDLFNEWDKFSHTFEKYIKNSQIKDKFSLTLSKQLDSEGIQADYRYYIISVLFHSIIKPIRTSENKLPTIVQAQRDLCVICDSEDECINTIKSMRDDFKAAQQSLFPRIFTIKQEDSLTKFFVVCNGLEFKLPTYLRALDVALKLKFVLNVKFSESTELFWGFVTRHFYNINYQNKSKNNQILLLEQYLLNQK
ncbi:uncharacterized protein LOC131429297 [Malaya genurostris]|uniref:uncharacterized protein LOC131429297 n=1 Tax=Malaya genurostris TaxID=325434 RepID=UPI0026F3BE96|nr:uncharacterized protein LOC131429297 [Malaya genurostris]